MMLKSFLSAILLLQMTFTTGGAGDGKDDPTRDELLIQAARNAALAGDEPSAIVRFQQYMELHPDDGQAALELAGLLRRAQRTNEAIDVCRTAIQHVGETQKADPKQPAPMLQLARLHRWLREYGEADRWYAQYLALVPDDRVARLEYARLAGWDLRYNDALRQYETLEFEFPDDEAIALEHQAKQLNWDNRPRKASERYERALTLRPGDPELRFDLAQMYSRRGFSARAESLYGDILKTMPDHSMAAQAQQAEYWRRRPRITVDQQFYDRKGRDGTVDISAFRTDVRLSPERLAEALDVSIGAGQSFFNFDHKPPIDTTPTDLERFFDTLGFTRTAQIVRAYRQLPDRRRRERYDAHSPATHLTLAGDKRFDSDSRLKGDLEFTAYDQHSRDTFRFHVDAAHRIEDALELAIVGGLDDVLENFATLDDGLSRYFVGGRFGWDPIPWFRTTGRIYYYFYDDGNRAIDYLVKPDFILLPYPHILTLRSQFQGLHFANTKNTYWTPRVYWNVQAGLSWRHYLGDWHFEGAETLCYYVESYAGLDNGQEPQVHGKFGVQWDSHHKWKVGIELSTTQSDVYDENRVLLSLSRAW